MGMGYFICARVGKAGEGGQAKLIEANETERIAAYAMCAESYGFSILYLGYQQLKLQCERIDELQIKVEINQKTIDYNQITTTNLKIDTTFKLCDTA